MTDTTNKDLIKEAEYLLENSNDVSDVNQLFKMIETLKTELFKVRNSNTVYRKEISNQITQLNEKTDRIIKLKELLTIATDEGAKLYLEYQKLGQNYNSLIEILQKTSEVVEVIPKTLPPILEIDETVFEDKIEVEETETKYEG